MEIHRGSPARLQRRALKTSEAVPWPGRRHPQVDGYRSVECRLVPLLNRPEVSEAGIDNQDIERAERRSDGVGQGSLGFNAAGIGMNGRQFRPESGSDVLEPAFISAGDRHAGTFGQKKAERSPDRCRLCRR